MSKLKTEDLSDLWYITQYIKHIKQDVNDNAYLSSITKISLNRIQELADGLLARYGQMILNDIGGIT